jgi:ankyrin repeat protein
MIDLTTLYKKRSDLVEYIESNDVKSLKCLLSGTNDSLEKTDDIQREIGEVNQSKCIPAMNLNFVDREGQTPLHRSCISGNLNIVKLLVQYGSSQNIKNNDGWFPIHLASYHGHLDIIKYLIDEKNFNKDSLVAVFDDHNGNLNSRNSSKLNLVQFSSSLYRSKNENEHEDDDESDLSFSSTSDIVSNFSEEEDDDYSECNYDKLIGSENNLNEHLNESLYLNNLNIEELKNLDLNENLFDLSLNNLTLDTLKCEFFN